MARPATTPERETSSAVFAGTTFGLHRRDVVTTHAEQRGNGEATLEQFRADVIRLSHDYMTGEPFPLFLQMRRVRNRMHEALEQHLWP